jgi:2-(1,2-epoxy-1,2-dihydrophenyl)acetyl-CoA isomerase
MAEGEVVIERDGRVAIFRINRPQVMNALNRSVRGTLTEAVRAAVADGARAVVLTGTGRAFSSGQDLTDVGDLDAADFSAILREEYEPLLRAIRDCPVPVLAAVNGTAAGAGANLALGCDVVIAAESASFIQAFTRIGLMPDAGGTWTLPRQVGLARAMGAALFAEPVPARLAAEWGMIWEAVPDAAFEAQWRARARALAAGPTAAYAAIKRTLLTAFETPYAAQLEHEAEGQAACGRTDDFREGVAAFLEKRPARFTGR